MLSNQSPILGLIAKDKTSNIMEICFDGKFPFEEVSYVSGLWILFIEKSSGKW